MSGARVRAVRVLSCAPRVCPVSSVRVRPVPPPSSAPWGVLFVCLFVCYSVPPDSAALQTFASNNFTNARDIFTPTCTATSLQPSFAGGGLLTTHRLRYALLCAAAVVLLP